MKYFFIFGNNPSLSLAELTSIFPHLVFDVVGKNFCIVQHKDPLDCNKLQQKLGGTIKIGEIFDEVDIRMVSDNESLTETLYQHLPETDDKKLSLGISIYGNSSDGRPIMQKKDILKLGMMLKKTIRSGAKKKSVRFVTSKELTLSSVVVKTNHLLDDNGVELVFLAHQSKMYLGKTLTVQEFTAYSTRDYGRPARDDLSGMLPPKLAQIMINLAGEFDEHSLLLDPFCGSGTILQEAALIGYKNIYGSDRSQKAIQNTIENIAWLQKKLSQFFDAHITVKQRDTTKLTLDHQSCSVDKIVTEPYLGPALRENPSFHVLTGILEELEQLYFSSFKTFHKILKPKGRIVFIFPVFDRNKTITNIDDILAIGFECIEYPNTLLYARDDQKIRRMIQVFRKR